jgi:hypothetical protein
VIGGAPPHAPFARHATSQLVAAHDTVLAHAFCAEQHTVVESAWLVTSPPHEFEPKHDTVVVLPETSIDDAHAFCPTQSTMHEVDAVHAIGPAHAPLPATPHEMRHAPPAHAAPALHDP